MSQLATDIGRELVKMALGPQTPTQCFLKWLQEFLIIEARYSAGKRREGLSYRVRYRLECWLPLLWTHHTRPSRGNG